VTVSFSRRTLLHVVKLKICFVHSVVENIVTSLCSVTGILVWLKLLLMSFQVYSGPNLFEILQRRVGVISPSLFLVCLVPTLIGF
jgi:hypothetical protein